MPCWTVQTNTVVLNEMDHDLRVAALKEMGAEVSAHGKSFSYKGNGYSIRGDTLESYAGQQTVANTAAELNAAYAEQVVLYTAERTGFTVIRTDKRKFRLVRRNY